MPAKSVVKIGDRFNALTVIEELEPIKKPYSTIRVLLVKCDCGTVKPVYLKRLKGEITKTCGCGITRKKLMGTWINQT